MIVLLAILYTLALPLALSVMAIWLWRIIDRAIWPDA